MFPITVTIHNPAQLNAVMAVLAADQVPAPVVTQPKPEKVAKPKAEPKPEAAEGNAAAASSAPATTAAPAASSTDSEQPAADAAPAIAIADVNAAIIALAKAKGRDAAVAVLKEFGVAKAPELKAEQYAAVVAAAKKAMA